MRASGPDLALLATRLAKVLGPDQCLLVGGLAVSGHGYVRATDDIDLVVSYPLAQARRKLQAAGIPAALRAGDALDGDFPVVRGEIEGVPFDILPALVALDWEKGVEARLGAGRLRLVDLDGLLRLKLRAQGVQDLLDVAVLVLRNPTLRERAREVARAYHTLERLDTFLADRRTKATAADQEARDGGEAAARPPVSRKARAKARAAARRRKPSGTDRDR